MQWRLMAPVQSARLPAVHLAAEDDRGGGFLHPVQAADLVEQLVELFGRVAVQPGYIIELAADRTQLLHLAHGAGGARFPCPSAAAP